MGLRLAAVVVMWLVAVPALAQEPDFAGWGWGPSIGFVSQKLGADLVEPGGAIIDETGILRVIKDVNSQPMLLMGTHYILGRIAGKVGIGPGLIVRPGDDLVDAAGGGIVFEFRDPGATAGFTVGVGAVKVFSTSRLASGWADGEPAPSTNIQFREQSETFLGIWTGVGF